MKVGLVASLLALLLAGCADDDGEDTAPTTTAPPGDLAVWDLDGRPSASATSFTAEVARVGCNDGETGRVLEPSVVEAADQVVVTFWVEPTSPGDHTCPGNAPVAVEVALAAPIGDRDLVDGACRGTDPAPDPLCERRGVR